MDNKSACLSWRALVQSLFDVDVPSLTRIARSSSQIRSIGAVLTRVRPQAFLFKFPAALLQIWIYEIWASQTVDSEAMASKSRSWSSISFLIVPDFPLWFSLLSFLLHSDFNFFGLAHHLALPIVDNYKNQFGALHKPHDKRNETKNDRQKHSL